MEQYTLIYGVLDERDLFTTIQARVGVSAEIVTPILQSLELEINNLYMLELLEDNNFVDIDWYEYDFANIEGLVGAFRRKQDPKNTYNVWLLTGGHSFQEVSGYTFAQNNKAPDMSMKVFDAFRYNPEGARNTTRFVD